MKKGMVVLGVMFLLLMRGIAGTGTTTIPTPHHVYISIGHLPYMAHDKDNEIYLAIFICRDKQGNRIMVGINIKELQDIWTQLNSAQIKYEDIDSGDQFISAGWM